MTPRKTDHEYKLLFRGGQADPTITITSTPHHLLCINHSTAGQVHYDVTNIVGAAAYISGVYRLDISSRVELIHNTPNKVIASWDYMALRTGSNTLSINNVKSILKSLQIWDF